MRRSALVKHFVCGNVPEHLKLGLFMAVLCPDLREAVGRPQSLREAETMKSIFLIEKCKLQNTQTIKISIWTAQDNTYQPISTNETANLSFLR